MYNGDCELGRKSSKEKTNHDCGKEKGKKRIRKKIFVH